MKDNSEKNWCVLDWHGNVISNSVARTRSEAIEKYLKSLHNVYISNVFLNKPKRYYMSTPERKSLWKNHYDNGIRTSKITPELLLKILQGQRRIKGNE